MWVREMKRGGRETERGREMLPLYVHFCVVALPWGRERGHIALGMCYEHRGNIYCIQYVHTEYTHYDITW